MSSKTFLNGNIDTKFVQFANRVINKSTKSKVVVLFVDKVIMHMLLPGFALRPGDQLVVEVSCRDAYLRLCSVAAVRDGHEVRLDRHHPLLDPRQPGTDPKPTTPTPTPEAELCSALAGLQTHQSAAKEDLCVLECSEIALLNNTHYHQSFSRALDTLLTGDLARVRENGAPADPLNSSSTAAATTTTTTTTTATTRRRGPPLRPGRVGGLLAAVADGGAPRPRQGLQLGGEEPAPGRPEEAGGRQRRPRAEAGVLAEPGGGRPGAAEEALAGEAVERHHPGLRGDLRPRAAEVDGEGVVGQVRAKVENTGVPIRD